jgi:hypothetical protein
MTIEVVASRKPQFGRTAWKQVAKRTATIAQAPSLATMAQAFGVDVGGSESADGSEITAEFVMKDPDEAGMSLMTVITIRSA